jgi:hypothetical protein
MNSNTETDLDFLTTCICKRTFYTLGSLKKHLRSCTQSKKWTFGALDCAKDQWRAKKKQCLQDATDSPGTSHGSSNENIVQTGVEEGLILTPPVSTIVIVCNSEVP